jgi:Zinc finger, C2H2 type
MNAENVYSCPKCKWAFIKKTNLNNHIGTRKCLDNLKQVTHYIDFPVKKKIICEYCKKEFKKESKLKIHLQNIKGECFKLRTECGAVVNNYITNNQTYNNINYNIGAINNVNIQPVIEKVILAKPGEETISHITKDVMLKILDIESFPEMCTELMRLLYFNKEVPENRNWTIVYPKNKNAGIEFNHETLRFERKKTYNIIDDKFSNMVSLLFDLVQEISRDDIENNHLTKRQKINVNKYCMHYGQLDISKTSKNVYDSIHSLAFNSRIDQMKEWGYNGHTGNHLSLKFK